MAEQHVDAQELARHQKDFGGFVRFMMIVVILVTIVLLGMAAFTFQDSILRSRWLLCSLVASAIIAAHCSIHAAHLVVPLALAYGIFHFSFSKTVNVQNAARWGDFSYGTYLYAFPIQQMIIASFGSTISFPFYIVLSMGLAVLSGAASWHLVERWFVRTRSSPYHSVALKLTKPSALL